MSPIACIFFQVSHNFMKHCSCSVIFFSFLLSFLSFSPFFVGALIVLLMIFRPQAIFIPPPPHIFSNILYRPLPHKGSCSVQRECGREMVPKTLVPVLLLLYQRTYIVTSPLRNVKKTHLVAGPWFIYVLIKKLKYLSLLKSFFHYRFLA